MKRSGYARRILAAVLTLTLLLGLALPAGAVGKSDVIHPAFVQVEGSETDAIFPGEAAAELEEPQYKDTDQVRVSIVLKEKSTVQAGFSTQAIAANPAAIQYRDKLETSQAAVTAAIIPAAPPPMIPMCFFISVSPVSFFRKNMSPENHTVFPHQEWTACP